MIRRMLIFAIVLYVAWCATLYIFQERLMFPGSVLRQDGDSVPRPAAAEVLWRDIGDGKRVEAWFIPGRGCSAASPGPLIVVGHGNADLIDDYPEFMHPYTDWGISLLLVEYRGFARSKGKPGERAIVGDFVYFLDQIAQRPEVDPRRIVYHGRSIGGAVVAQLANVRPPAALILESTFLSMGMMAWKYAAPGFLVRHPFRTDEALARFDGPVLIFHGGRDPIVPVSHGRQLAKIARHARYVEYPTGKHNDFPPDEEDYWRQIESFLRENHILTSQ